MNRSKGSRDLRRSVNLRKSRTVKIKNVFNPNTAERNESVTKSLSSSAKKSCFEFFATMGNKTTSSPVVLAASEGVAAPTGPPKKATEGKPGAKPTHPRTFEMVNAAIKDLKERGGSSLQAIKKYMAGTYKIDTERQAPFIKKYLKSAVESGTLIQTKGKGAAGSFKLAASAKAELAKPKAKVASKAKVIKKAPAAKKPASGTPKMTAAKKAATAAVSQKRQFSKGPAAKPPKAKTTKPKTTNAKPAAKSPMKKAKPAAAAKKTKPVAARPKKPTAAKK